LLQVAAPLGDKVRGLLRLQPEDGGNPHDARGRIRDGTRGLAVLQPVQVGASLTP